MKWWTERARKRVSERENREVGNEMCGGEGRTVVLATHVAEEDETPMDKTEKGHPDGEDGDCFSVALVAFAIVEKDGKGRGGEDPQARTEDHPLCSEPPLFSPH